MLFRSDRIQVSVKMSQDNKYTTLQDLAIANKEVIDELAPEYLAMLK